MMKRIPIDSVRIQRTLSSSATSFFRENGLLREKVELLDKLFHAKVNILFHFENYSSLSKFD